MKRGGQPRGRGDGGGERISDGELLRWAGGIAKARGRVRAAHYVGLNYRTLAKALDDRRLSRLAREALLEAHRAESIANAQAEKKAGRELGRRLEATETQLADALDTLGQERERADALEHRLTLLEERQTGEPDTEGTSPGPKGQASEPSTEMPAGEPGVEPQDAGLIGRQEPEAEGSAIPGSTHEHRTTHQRGVVTLEPLDGEEGALGEAAGLVDEWRRLRREDAQRGSAVHQARARERRWELEVALVGEHGLALPPETEPLHPSRRDDQLRWRRVTLLRARRQRVRAERLRLLRRILSLGLWWR